MNYILFDDSARTNLLPLTYTRPVCELRVGILTIREKWETWLGAKTSTLTEGYLSKKWPIFKEKESILINGSILPNKQLIAEILKLKTNEVLTSGETIVAYYIEDPEKQISSEKDKNSIEIEAKSEFIKINFPWDIFGENGKAICCDFELITKGRKSSPLSETVKTINPENIFIEEGATVEFATLNASKGPIYIGKDAEIMEGASVRGPFALCEHGVIKMNSSIYQDCTFGPWCKVGGEISNSVFQAYSNKPHEGFMGNSVIGEWCNVAAGANTSNLNNTYKNIKVWNYGKKRFIDTGKQFCGLIMGDHSKCGIDTMFNTGTVLGVNCNVYGAGYHRNFIQSFSWGSPTGGYIPYNFKKSNEVAIAVMKRRNITLTEDDITILKHIYDITRLNDRI